jgi:hypothetical protein
MENDKIINVEDFEQQEKKLRLEEKQVVINTIKQQNKVFKFIISLFALAFLTLIVLFVMGTIQPSVKIIEHNNTIYQNTENVIQKECIVENNTLTKENYITNNIINNISTRASSQFQSVLDANINLRTINKKYINNTNLTVRLYNDLVKLGYNPTMYKSNSMKHDDYDTAIQVSIYIDPVLGQIVLPDNYAEKGLNFFPVWDGK